MEWRTWRILSGVGSRRTPLSEEQSILNSRPYLVWLRQNHKLETPFNEGTSFLLRMRALCKSIL